VIEARYEELFTLVLAHLRRNGFEELIAAGIVLTGGGSKIDGAIDLAESVFQVPVRLGVPQNVAGLMDVCDHPSYATGVGLLLYGLQQRGTVSQFELNRGFNSIWDRMKGWFTSNF